jgi:hypothetical protein
MHLERRSSPSQNVCYPDKLAALRASAFGNHPTLGVCWGEPPDSNLILDILCDWAQNDLLGLSGKGIKNPNPLIQILHVVYETPLPATLGANNTRHFMRQCTQLAFRYNLCSVHSDIYPRIFHEFIGLKHGFTPVRSEAGESITLYYPMEAGDLPRLILFDLLYCRDK